MVKRTVENSKYGGEVDVTWSVLWYEDLARVLEEKGFSSEEVSLLWSLELFV